ncbi:MAG: hypothetical protein P8R54_01355 [Myxococcota bacterium]|nr:hypothetical protein [Myxococcota bacterium]
MSRRSRLVVITALGALSCHQGTVNPPPVVPPPLSSEETAGGAAAQPTSPEAVPSGLTPLAEREAAQSTSPLPDSPVRASLHGALLNPKDASERTIFLSSDGERCYVELPFPSGVQVPPGSAPPHATVTCPPLMSDPAWLACPAGTIQLAEEPADACLCMVMGNPPPPPRWVHCPDGA